jgi:hypothetical protein
LLSERLVTTGYSVCIIDPEGDHVGLGAVRGVFVASGADATPPLDQLLRFGSVVVDLSQRPPDTRGLETRHVLEVLGKLRRCHGTPHWIILDEAHLVPDLAGVLDLAPGRDAGGVCAVTWRPEELSPETLTSMDYAVTLPCLHSQGASALRQASFSLANGSDSLIVRGQIRGLLLDRHRVTPFVADERSSPHLRHWHKYYSAELPFHQRFFFRRGNRPTGAVAANMSDFHYEIARAEAEVLRHHAGNRDFSRWIDEIIRDHGLAEALRHIEESLSRNGTRGAEQGRRHLLEAIEAHYAGG